MKVEAQNGKLVLAKSDTIIVYEDQDLTLTFDEQFKLAFDFVEDSTVKESKMEIVSIDGGVKIKLTNFNNPIGTATGSPIPFATVDDKSVYASFAVYSIGKTKILHYNIHKEQ